MAKETITRNEYLQLMGLALIAKQGYDKLVSARDAMHSVLESSENDDVGSWVEDMVWGGETDIDHLLKTVGITFEQEAVNADS